MNCTAKLLAACGGYSWRGGSEGWQVNCDAKLPFGDAESRALAYLAQEVPRWTEEHRCFSCHNNGDAARALYLARLLKLSVPAKVLDDTTAWLEQPDRWDHNGGDGPSSDRRLARIQFTSALRHAAEAGIIRDASSLSRAAERLAFDQQPDGSWQIDATGSIGSPTTYGNILATFVASDTLRALEPVQFERNVARGAGWLRSAEIRNMVDAAAIVLASRQFNSDGWDQPRRNALALIGKGQSDDGGWGPYASAAPEPFDTAVVLLALVRLDRGGEFAQAIARGRDFLIKLQLDDGSWPETTRPAGAESYAQRISTSAWVTIALLETRGVAANR